MSSSKKGGRRGKKAAPPPSPPSSSDAESDGDDSERSYEEEARRWQRLGGREAELDDERAAGILETAKGMHVDDLSSDDEEAGNATGRVPLHWYEGYDHVGYDLGGGKVVADAPNDALAQALEAQGGGALTVYDKLNGRNVVVSARELEQIRRMKGGAFATGQDKRAKFPTSKAPLSAVFYSFRLIFGRAIISRNGLEAWMLFPERARAEHSR